MGVGLLVFVEECIIRYISISRLIIVFFSHHKKTSFEFQKSFDTFRIAQPLFLGYLIRYFTHSDFLNERDGYLFAGAVVILSACCTFTHHPFFFGVQHTGMKIRVACCALVYRKVKFIISKCREVIYRWFFEVSELIELGTPIKPIGFRENECWSINKLDSQWCQSIWSVYPIFTLFVGGTHTNGHCHIYPLGILWASLFGRIIGSGAFCSFSGFVYKFRT